MVLMTSYNQPSPNRPVGKLGRLPGYVPNGLRDLTWYAAGALPTPPLEVTPPVIRNSDGTLWGMDGNDTYGNCGVAGLHHSDMCVDLIARKPLLPIHADDVVNYYLTYTDGQDDGVVLADFLSYVHVKGWWDRQVAAYAPVSVTDYATLQFVINGYGSAYTGIQVTDLMQQAFGNGQPWTAADFANGNVVGGHCVPLVGYDSNFLYAVTWGGVQPIQYSAWHLIAEEAWAVLWGETPVSGLDQHGVSLASLQSDLSKLTR